MEIPYSGRSTVTDYGTQTEISIPAKRIYFIMIFFGIWSCGWIIGGLTAIMAGLTSGDADFPAIPFALVWIIITTVIVCFIGRIVWWMAFGKEIITIGQGVLTVVKKGALFIQPKSYDLNEAKSFRVQEDFISYQNVFGFNRAMFWNVMGTGTIRFDYGMQTIKIAGNIDEAEAKYLLQLLKDKSLLKESNF